MRRAGWRKTGDHANHERWEPPSSEVGHTVAVVLNKNAGNWNHHGPGNVKTTYPEGTSVEEVVREAGKKPAEFREGHVWKVRTGPGTSQAEYYKVLKAPSPSAAAPHAMLVQKHDFLGKPVEVVSAGVAVRHAMAPEVPHRDDDGVGDGGDGLLVPTPAGHALILRREVPVLREDELTGG